MKDIMGSFWRGHGVEQVYPDTLVGHTVTRVTESGAGLLEITTDKGRYMFDHQQDCCENVSLLEQEPDAPPYASMKGKTIVGVTGEQCNDLPEDVRKEYDYDLESWTLTRFVFEMSDGSKVPIRFLGTSNGYYSETVYFAEV
jgi:hypothetical protein